jgi:hypothetical protein
MTRGLGLGLGLGGAALKVIPPFDPYSLAGLKWRYDVSLETSSDGLDLFSLQSRAGSMGAMGAGAFANRLGIYRTGILNKPVLRTLASDGGQRVVARSALGAWDGTFSMFWVGVIRTIGAPATNKLYKIMDSSFTNHMNVNFAGSNNFVNQGTTASQKSGFWWGGAGSRMVITHECSNTGNTANLRVNASDISLSGGTGTTSLGMDLYSDLIYFWEGTTSERCDFDLGEWMFYSPRLSVANRNSVETFLLAKWV